MFAGHSQRASNATTATYEYRFLQVSIKPVLSVYPQSDLQFTCSIKMLEVQYSTLQAKNSVPRFLRGTPFWDAENSEPFGEAILASFSF
jgi:hypothetical protein